MLGTYVSTIGYSAVMTFNSRVKIRSVWTVATRKVKLCGLKLDYKNIGR